METIISSFVEMGILGTFLAVLIYYMNKLTDHHRTERKEWAESSNEHVNRFADVITDSTKILTELRSEIRENKCKMD